MTLSILLLTRTREVTDNLEEVEATYLSVRMSGWRWRRPG